MDVGFCCYSTDITLSIFSLNSIMIHLVVVVVVVVVVVILILLLLLDPGLNRRTNRKLPYIHDPLRLDLESINPGSFHGSCAVVLKIWLSLANI